MFFSLKESICLNLDGKTMAAILMAESIGLQVEPKCLNLLTKQNHAVDLTYTQ
jgi:hypothetical protein